jgi:hypothetical protein
MISLSRPNDLNSTKYHTLQSPSGRKWEGERLTVTRASSPLHSLSVSRSAPSGGVLPFMSFKLTLDRECSFIEMIFLKPEEHRIGTDSKHIGKDKMVLKIINGSKENTIIGDDG